MEFVETAEGKAVIEALRKEYPGEYRTFEEVAQVAERLLPNRSEVIDAIRIKSHNIFHRAVLITCNRTVNIDVLANMDILDFLETREMARNDLCAMTFLEELYNKIEEKVPQHHGLQHVVER